MSGAPLRDAATLVRGLALGAVLGVLAVLAGCQTPGASGAPGMSASPGGAVLPESSEENEERRRARIRLELGASYYQQGNYAVALEELRQALIIDSSYALAYGVLGLVYMDMGERARAEESFQRGLRIAPADSELNNNYGWFLCQGGRHRDSLEYFQRALRNPLYPTPAKPLHNAGLCAQRMGDDKAAEAYFLRAFQVQPSDPVAMYNLGLINLKRRDVDRARFYAQRLLVTFEPTPEVLWLALRVERLAGNVDAIASLSSQLRRRFPESREAQLLASGNFSD